MPAVAAYLAGNVKLMTSRRHVRATRARLALLLDETVRAAMEAGHHRFLEMLEVVLKEGGHPDPEPAARAVADLLEGALRGPLESAVGACTPYRYARGKSMSRS